MKDLADEIRCMDRQNIHQLADRLVKANKDMRFMLDRDYKSVEEIKKYVAKFQKWFNARSDLLVENMNKNNKRLDSLVELIAKTDKEKKGE